MAGSNIELAGAADFNMSEGDNITLTMFRTNIWTETARTDLP